MVKLSVPASMQYAPVLLVQYCTEATGLYGSVAPTW